MTTINNIQPLRAEELYNLLKKDFTTYVDKKMDSSLEIEYAHVYDIINISFPEVIEGIAFTISVSDDEITVEEQEENADYDSELLEGHLIDFLKEICA
jgi:hypothetical protein